MNDIFPEEKFKLRPRARIVRTFGEELISNDLVAITELVKNSYDADATQVDIEFESDDNNIVTFILISDNGHGMTRDQVKSGWMEPASITKASLRKSATKQRSYLGAKGVGRFSAAKLGTTLELVTRAENSPEVYVNFHWPDYDGNDKYLDEIEGVWGAREPKELKNPGTILRIGGIKSEWNSNRVRELRTHLSRLVNPLAPINDFEINLSVDFDKTLSGTVYASSTMDRPNYVIKGVFDEKGTLNAAFQSKKHPSESTNFSEEIILEDGQKPRCGPFTFELRVWDRDNLKELADAANSSIKMVRDDLNEIAGISVYRDGFRVAPYGNRQNDWLRLDLRRVQNPTIRVSQNQIVGQVAISDERNSDLKDQTNREGIVESEAFDDFKDVIVKVLSILEDKRYKERRELEKGPDDSRYKLFQDINLESVRSVLDKKLPGDKEVKDILDEKEGEIKSRVEEFRDFIVRYRRLSTLGQLIDIVLHDAGAALSRLSLGLKIIEKGINKGDIDRKKISENIANSLEGASLLSELFKRLEPFGGRKRERTKEVVIENAVRDVFAIFGDELKSQKIRVVIPDTETIYKLSESDFKMVFVNLLSNSLYWLRKIDAENRKILVQIKSVDDGLEIIFADSGPGIDQEDAPYIFDPYYSKKPDGIGLGLAIVGEYISELRGTFDLVPSGILPGACFRIRLPV